MKNNLEKKLQSDLEAYKRWSKHTLKNALGENYPKAWFERNYRLLEDISAEIRNLSEKNQRLIVKLERPLWSIWRFGGSGLKGSPLDTGKLNPQRLVRKFIRKKRFESIFRRAA